MEKKRIAKNGIAVYEYKNPKLHGFFASLFLRAGSMYEAQGDEGITHFLEHVLVRNVNKLSDMKLYEELDERGFLFTDTLRGAKQTDTYIASGDDRDLTVWQPKFTYHGFRYAEIKGLSLFDRHNIVAVAQYNDIKNESTFRCGSAIVNAIHDMVVKTEKANMHSILTDCPQRDERMAWMNDATVRFEETPYNFDIGRMLPKIIRDIRDEHIV